MVLSAMVAQNYLQTEKKNSFFIRVLPTCYATIRGMGHFYMFTHANTMSVSAYQLLFAQMKKVFALLSLARAIAFRFCFAAESSVDFSKSTCLSSSSTC